jgi:hypothetical protein
VLRGYVPARYDTSEAAGALIARPFKLARGANRSSSASSGDVLGAVTSPWISASRGVPDEITLLGPQCPGEHCRSSACIGVTGCLWARRRSFRYLTIPDRPDVVRCSREVLRGPGDRLANSSAPGGFDSSRSWAFLRRSLTRADVTRAARSR